MTPYNIVMETESVVDEDNVVSYQLKVNTLQEAGAYTNNVATATF